MKFLRSFAYAFNGILQCLLKERNFQIQFMIGITIIIFGFFYHISNMEWVSILLCCAIVLSLEMFNSAIEKICNFISPEYHDSIKPIKDIAAGAVLVSSILALIIGLIIFIPKVLG